MIWWQGFSPRPRYCLIWNIEKVIIFLDTLDSNKIELKLLTYKLTMLLALTGSSRSHEICYLDIRYLIRHSSAYCFHFSKVTNTTKKRETRPPIKHLNFTSSKSICFSPHWLIHSKNRIYFNLSVYLFIDFQFIYR